MSFKQMMTARKLAVARQRIEMRHQALAARLAFGASPEEFTKFIEDDDG